MSLGICYYPEHWPEAWWEQDARRMRELGIDYVRIGEFAWSRYEPERGRFDWGWLDRAMDVLAKAGLKIVLGTPTCTPPKWIVDDNPDMIPVDEQGRPRGFGSRCHYTFSSKAYWEESRRIVEILAQRYGNHPGLVGWQTDNEYGCHDSILSWSQTDLKAFQEWLRRKYQSPDQLNEAWGNAFWSMELTRFDQVSLPNLAVTETNPAAKLDYWRFHSEQVSAFDRMQCEITHNFMGFFNDFDHWAVGDNLDLSSWDSYPIGFVERFPFTEEEKNRWALTSHPDIAPFHHDLYRGVGHGRFWVMEQQPGPVNWAPWNPVPKRGMVRLWTWEALAHGADVVSYFRWRQATFAQEQMHAGLNLAGQHEWSQGGREAGTVGGELKSVGTLPATRQAPVAIVYDYVSSWITRIQPQGADFRYFELVFRWYEALRRLGLDVDFVRPGAPLKGYRLVLVPALLHVDGSAEAAFTAADGIVLYGPRSGSKTQSHGLPENLPPGPLSPLVKLSVLEVSSLRPGLTARVNGAVTGKAERWREFVAARGSDVLASFEDGSPALTAAGGHHYLACWPDRELLSAVLALICRKAGLFTVDLPEGIRLRRRGNLVFAFNYGEESWTYPSAAHPLLGTATVPPQGLAIFWDA